MLALFGEWRRRLGGEEGIALVIAIGTCFVLGIAGTTAMVYTTANHRAAARSKADVSALSLAEAGLNYAYSTIYNAPDPSMPGAVPQRTETLEGGTATYHGTLDTQTNVWTLTGVGRLANPARGADVVRTVRGKVRLGTSQHGSADNAVWNYVYADDVSSCTELRNSTSIDVPLYVRGDLCLRNTAQVSGYTVQVGGTVTFRNESHAGASGALLHEAHVGGGCRIDDGPLSTPCGPSTRVYAETVDNHPSGLTKPPVDLAYWYQNAQPGPMHPCTTGSFPGGFDNDTALNRSRDAVDLAPELPYDCQVKDATGSIVGRIAWSGGSDGTLTIAGTIFVDGNISFKNYLSAVYSGRATVYASGSIEIRNDTSICGVAGCGANWQPTQSLLALVAGGDYHGVSVEIRNHSTFQGAIYAVADYEEENQATVWGPIIARQLYFRNSTTNHYVPLGVLLPGMPATYAEVVTLINEPLGYS